MVSVSLVPVRTMPEYVKFPTVLFLSIDFVLLSLYVMLCNYMYTNFLQLIQIAIEHSEPPHRRLKHM